MRYPTLFVRGVDLFTQMLYRASGGRLGERQLSYSVLLLRTVGRKTGKTRTHAVMYLREGDNLIVCASNNGAARHPAWYFNLQAHPRAWVQVGRACYEVFAETAGQEDRQHLWQQWLKARPQTAEYQAATTREFPMIMLKPLPPTATVATNNEMKRPGVYD